MPLKTRQARLLAVIALAAVAAFALPWIAARTPFARGMVAGWIEDAARLPAGVESLRLGFLPSPSVTIEGLSIAQPAGFGDGPFITAGELRLRIPWSGIFGVSDVTSIEARDASARLVVNPDGMANWSKLGGEPVPGPAAAPAEPVAWRVGAFSLERGSVEYRDLAAGSQVEFTAITITADDVEPGAAFPFDVQLGAVSGTNTAHFATKGQGRIDAAANRYEGSSLEFRGWLGGEPLPLAGAELSGALGHVVYDVATGVATLTEGQFRFAEVPGRFEGRLDLGKPELAGSVEVTTDAFAPRAPAIILGSPLPATADPAAFASLQLALTATLEGGVLRLDPVTGRLDDTNFEASADPAGRFVRAALDRIDLDRYRPPAASPASGRAATARGTAAPTKEATLEATAAQIAKLDLDAEIRIEEARVAGATLRDRVIRVERDAEPAP